MEPEKQENGGTSVDTEKNCLLCRVTYSIFAHFPTIPSALALNVETGNFFPLDTLRSYSTGREMVEAVGSAWACRCSKGWFDQQFVLHDGLGNVLNDTCYTLRFPDGRLAHGTTDSQGRTRRHRTNDARQIAIYLGHKEA